MLRKAYLLARRIECGLIAGPAAEELLPTKKAAAKKKKPELTEAEKELKADGQKGWQYSDAKAALKAAIMEGEVPLEASADEDENDLRVYFEGIPHVLNYGGFDKFRKRLNDLRDQIRNDRTRAEEDEEAFFIFCKNHPKATVAAKGTYPEWEGSEAQKLLLIDLDNGLHKEKTKEALWKSKAVYQQFPLKVFREHIYQVFRTNKYLNHIKKTGKGGNRWKDFRKGQYESSGESCSSGGSEEETGEDNDGSEEETGEDNDGSEETGDS